MRYLGSSSDVLQVPPRHSDAYLLGLSVSLRMECMYLSAHMSGTRGHVRNDRHSSFETGSDQSAYRLQLLLVKRTSLVLIC